jgi:hypothetical protein
VAEEALDVKAQLKQLEHSLPLLDAAVKKLAKMEQERAARRREETRRLEAEREAAEEEARRAERELERLRGGSPSS